MHCQRTRRGQLLRLETGSHQRGHNQLVLQCALLESLRNRAQEDAFQQQCHQQAASVRSVAEVSEFNHLIMNVVVR